MATVNGNEVLGTVADLCIATREINTLLRSGAEWSELILDPGPSSSSRVAVTASRGGQFFSFGGDDSIPPVVTIVSPSPGTTIFRATKLKFRVTDNKDAFRRILPAVKYSNGKYELIHDGEAFAADYSMSTRSIIAGGFEYEVERTGGWPSAPTLVPFAYDISGNENL